MGTDQEKVQSFPVECEEAAADYQTCSHPHVDKPGRARFLNCSGFLSLNNTRPSALSGPGCLRIAASLAYHNFAHS